MKTFTAQVDEFIRDSKELMEIVHKESIQELVERMQRPQGKGGNLPIDTGFLRASLRASSDGSLPSTAKNPGQGNFTYDSGAISLVIAGLEMDQTFIAAYGANYARHVHYGANGRAGVLWVSLAAQQWPQIVDETVAKLKR